MSGLRVLGSIADELVEDYVSLVCPLGVQVLIGDDLDDIVRQIRINLNQQGTVDIELMDKDNFEKCKNRHL